MRQLVAVVTAGALASAVAASALTSAATPAAGATSGPVLLVQPGCTDGTPTPGIVSGGLLGDDQEYQVLLDTGDGTPDLLVEGMANGSGQFSQPVTFPALPDTGVVVRLFRNFPDGGVDTWVLATSRDLRRCTLTADPTTVPVESLPRPVQMTGTGFDPVQSVRLLVDGVPATVVVSDAKGSFTTPVTVPVRPCGPVPVRAVQLLPGGGISLVVGSGPAPVLAPPPPPPPMPTAATSVTVVCPVPTPTPTTSTPTPTTPTPTPTTPTPTPTATPPTPDARLTVDPLLASGGVGTALGTGFAPGRPVTLVWRLPDGSTAPGTSSVVADDAGRFAVPCLVLPRARLGGRTLEAVQPAPGGTRSAAATTLVVAGPMEPGRNRLLGRR